MTDEKPPRPRQGPHVLVEAWPTEIQAFSHWPPPGHGLTTTNDADGTALLAGWCDTLDPDAVLVSDLNGTGTAAIRALQAAGHPAKRFGVPLRGATPPRSGAEFGGIRARLAFTGVGWIRLTLTFPGGDAELLASPVVSPPWRQTVRALVTALEDADTVCFRWDAETESVEVRLDDQGGGRVRLVIEPDKLRLDEQADDLHAAPTRHDLRLLDLAAAIASASHVLIEDNGRWEISYRGFEEDTPTVELARLDHLLAVARGTGDA